MLLKLLFFAILLWLIFRAARNLLVAATSGLPSRQQRMEPVYGRSGRRRGERTPADSHTSGIDERDSRVQNIEDAVWEDLP